MGTDRNGSAEERSKGIATCVACGDVVSVWVTPDGTVEPISPQGVCACDDPTLRLVDEPELDIEQR